MENTLFEISMVRVRKRIITNDSTIDGWSEYLYHPPSPIKSMNISRVMVDGRRRR
jgi:hypothetical protein